MWLLMIVKAKDREELSCFLFVFQKMGKNKKKNFRNSNIRERSACGLFTSHFWQKKVLLFLLGTQGPNWAPWALKTTKKHTHNKFDCF